jgi:amidohydrolase
MNLSIFAAFTLFVAASGEDELVAALARAEPRVVAIRRAIHAHPELGEREHATAELVARELESLGLEVRRGIAGTGVVGILRGKQPGRVAAWRADMDALPIREETGLPFASTRTDDWGGATVGVMHACGHDLHVAIGLGVARVLADPSVRAGLAGTVLFVFQPAEEGLPDPGAHGARRMLEEGLFADPRPDFAFGLHANPLLEVGTVSAIPGPALAAVDNFRIVVRGKAAHGANPDKGVDPIVAASSLVLALQTIASRSIDTHELVVVTVGRFSAGNRPNIIPETAELEGTLRTHADPVRAQVLRRVEELAHGIAQAHGASAEVELRSITPATVNDPELTLRMGPVLESALGRGSLVAERPHMGGEDFAFVAAEVPSLYFFLGVRDPARGEPALLHTSRFDPDERALAVGTRAAVHVLIEALR